MAGEIIHFAGSTPPAGYLAANGQLVSRTTYAALYSAIGITYGAGDGTTTFAVPDLRGEFLRGADVGRGVDTGRALGSAQTQLVPRHNHRLPLGFDGTQTINLMIDPAVSGTAGKPAYGSESVSVGVTGGRTNNTSAGAFAATGGGSVTVAYTDANALNANDENRPRNIALLPCIAY